MSRAVSGIVLIVVVAFLAGIARTGGLDPLTKILDSLTGEGFNALRGV